MNNQPNHYTYQGLHLQAPQVTPSHYNGQNPWQHVMCPPYLSNQKGQSTRNNNNGYVGASDYGYSFYGPPGNVPTNIPAYHYSRNDPQHWMLQAFGNNHYWQPPPGGSGNPHGWPRSNFDHHAHVPVDPGSHDDDILNDDETLLEPRKAKIGTATLKLRLKSPQQKQKIRHGRLYHAYVKLYDVYFNSIFKNQDIVFKDCRESLLAPVSSSSKLNYTQSVWRSWASEQLTSAPHLCELLTLAYESISKELDPLANQGFALAFCDKYFSLFECPSDTVLYYQFGLK